MVGANRSLDAKGSYRGYAAFGKVVAGMDVVKRMLALPTGGGRGAMRGQMILKPVRLIRAVRLDGTPKPTGRPKPWTLFNPREGMHGGPGRSAAQPVDRFVVEPGSEGGRVGKEGVRECRNRGVA